MAKEIEQQPEVLPSGIAKIRARWHEVDSMAGVGLDPDINRFPQEIWDEVGSGNTEGAITLFNQRVIDATAPHVVDFKVNANFYQGPQGRAALRNTFSYLRRRHPHALRVYDGKFADVGHTAGHLAEEIFGVIDADAVLLNPYLGLDAIEPFTKWKDKLVVLCVNTSNPSADEIQNLPLASGIPLWRHILRLSMSKWNGNGNIIPVVSATHAGNLTGIREEIGQTPILLAGIGTQGGNLSESIGPCLDDEGYGIMISASRAILYPQRLPGESFADASQREAVGLKNRINAVKHAYGQSGR